MVDGGWWMVGSGWWGVGSGEWIGGEVEAEWVIGRRTGREGEESGGTRREGRDHKSGSHPSVDHKSGSHPPVDHKSGSHPPMDHKSGSHPSVDHRSGSHTSVDHRSGSHTSGSHPAAWQVGSELSASTWTQNEHASHFTPSHFTPSPNPQNTRRSLMIRNKQGSTTTQAGIHDHTSRDPRPQKTLLRRGGVRIRPGSGGLSSDPGPLREDRIRLGSVWDPSGIRRPTGERGSDPSGYWQI